MKANVVVTTIDQNALKKVILLEAKRFPNTQWLLKNEWWERTVKWGKAEEQLLGYMKRARATDNWQHTMYGIVVMGDMMSFYQLDPHSTDLQGYRAPSLTEEEADRVFYSILQDSLLVEKVLNDMKQSIRANRV
jgi:hypothetical protein